MAKKTVTTTTAPESAAPAKPVRRKPKKAVVLDPPVMPERLRTPEQLSPSVFVRKATLFLNQDGVLESDRVHLEKWLQKYSK